MRPYSVALVAFAATLVRTTHSLATSDTGMANISLPASVRSFNDSLGDVQAKLLVGAGEDALSEERTLNLDFSTDLKTKVYDLLKNLHPNDPPDVRAIKRVANQQAVELQLRMEFGSDQEKIERLKAMYHSARGKNEPVNMIKAARLEWDKAIALQAECEKLIQTHDLPPEVLIRKLILDVKIEGARVQVDENDNALRLKQPNPYQHLNLDFIKKYIKGFNKKHGTMFTLPATLLEVFGYIDDVASFLSIAVNKRIVEIKAKNVELTQAWMFKDWQQVAVYLKELMSQQGVLKHHNVESLINYTSALAFTIPSKKREIDNHLMETFGDEAKLLIKEADKMCEYWKERSKIIGSLLRSKRTAAVLTQGTESQMQKRFKRSDAANPSPSVEE